MSEPRARPLAGRAALVTGASRRRGIGFAIARRLARDGADVFVHGHRGFDAATAAGADDGGMAGIADALEAEGTRIAWGEADFLDPEAPARLVARAVEALGRLDVLVANHAYGIHQALEDLTAEEIDRPLLANVRGSLLLARAFALQHPPGAAGPPTGRILLFTSGQHRGAMSRELAYAASKGALHQLTASLADAVAGRGITVNTLNPGPTDTGWAGADEEARVRERMPFGRWGEPEDAARLVAFLASDEAAWITGQVIDSEGGFRR